jgi:transcriptional regulator of acetoin/glycerol metabolism
MPCIDRKQLPAVHGVLPLPPFKCDRLLHHSHTLMIQGEVPELVRYFLGRHRSRELTLSGEASAPYLSVAGNVRELERLVERALALMDTDRIELDDLPARIWGEFAEVLGPVHRARGKHACLGLS